MQLELLFLAHCLFRQEYGWVFQHDMILNIPFITDMQLILGYQCLRCDNFRRRSCDYKVGDEILILLDILLPWMTMDKVLILLFKYMPMVQLFFNKPCRLRNKLIFIASKLFKGKRFSFAVGEWAILHINTPDVYRVSVISYISEVNNERTRLTLIVCFGVNLENKLHTRINK